MPEDDSFKETGLGRNDVSSVCIISAPTQSEPCIQRCLLSLAQPSRQCLIQGGYKVGIYWMNALPSNSG